MPHQGALRRSAHMRVPVCNLCTSADSGKGTMQPLRKPNFRTITAVVVTSVAWEALLIPKPARTVLFWTTDALHHCCIPALHGMISCSQSEWQAKVGPIIYRFCFSRFQSHLLSLRVPSPILQSHFVTSQRQIAGYNKHRGSLDNLQWREVCVASVEDHVDNCYHSSCSLSCRFRRRTERQIATEFMDKLMNAVKSGSVIENLPCLVINPTNIFVRKDTVPFWNACIEMVEEKNCRVCTIGSPGIG
jgi:hypothetical protein